LSKSVRVYPQEFEPNLECRRRHPTARSVIVEPKAAYQIGGSAKFHDFEGAQIE
jgi:hypothetical protein